MPELTPDRRDRVGGLHLSYSLEQPLALNLDSGGGLAESWWVVAHESDPVTGRPGANVGRVHVVRARLDEPDLWDALDALEADLEAVGSAVVETDTGALVPELEHSIEPLGESLLILNSVTLAKDWRGYGLGRLLAGVALETLSGGARLAATYPAPLDEAGRADREASIAKLGAVWAGLGFTPFTDGVWVLDLNLARLGDAVTALRAEFGVPR